MVLRARSFVALAFAAVPGAAAYADAPSSVGTPSFNCNAAAAGGGTINWGDGVALMPSIGFSFSSVDSPRNTDSFSPFQCSNGAFVNKMGQDGVSYGDMFTLKFEDKTNSLLGLKLDGFDVATAFDIKIKDESLDDKHQDSFWDVTLLYHKYDDAGKVMPGDYKEFIGIQVDSTQQFVTDGSLTIENGGLVLDPTVPDPDAIISLYTAPQVVPEPGTLVLLGTGLLGIGAAVRRRLGW